MSVSVNIINQQNANGTSSWKQTESYVHTAWVSHDTYIYPLVTTKKHFTSVKTAKTKQKTLWNS